MNYLDKRFIDCTLMTEDEINKELDDLRDYCESINQEIDAMQGSGL